MKSRRRPWWQKMQRAADRAGMVLVRTLKPGVGWRESDLELQDQTAGETLLCFNLADGRWYSGNTQGDCSDWREALGLAAYRRWQLDLIAEAQS